MNKIKKVLLVGGAGYLGTILCELLLREGYKVTVFDNLMYKQKSLRFFKNKKRFLFVEGDIRDIPLVSKVIQGHDAVIMLAALVGEPRCNKNPKVTVEINYLATLMLAEACRYYKVKRFLFASTDSCYGIRRGIMYEGSPMNPISLYAVLKALIEKKILALSSKDFSATVLRMATIYGWSHRMRFDLLVNILTMHAAVNKKIKIYCGKQWRPLVHVRDAANAYLKVLKAPLKKTEGEIFNVGSNEQNYQLFQIGNVITDVFPKVEIETIKQSPDLRDYHVNFDKISKDLNYRVRYGVRDGILEIKKRLEKGLVASPNSKLYRNI